MGIGFTLALTVIGAIREIIGNGTIFSGFFLGGEELVKKLTISIPFISEHPVLIIALAPGGFFVYALVIALVNWIITRKGGTPRDFSCQGCALAAMCTQEKCIAELGEIELAPAKPAAPKAAPAANTVTKGAEA
jgi:electron transport complex protein RnfE